MIDHINFYVCDRKKECNTSPRCGTECFHTLDKEHEQKGIRKMTNQEAIQELKDASDSEVRFGDKEHHYDEVMKRVKAFGMAIKALEHEQKWIPVSERLPNRDEHIKNNGLFIVSDGNRSYSEWFDIYDKQKFGEPTMCGFRVDKCVIAWMPLPKPYNAESE